MYSLFVEFPRFIKPEIIPGLPIRWYGLMYVFAFATAFLVYRKIVRERRFPMTEDSLVGLFSWGIIGLLLGARIFFTLVYEPPETNVFLRKPWLIFVPFRDGKFTGFQGMSYHGGAIGCFLGALLWSRRHGYDFREICDMCGLSIPLGYTFGRIGNFINAELYGRVTDSPLGMLFPIPQWDTVDLFNPKVQWVREMMEKTGIDGGGGLVNLPRHPSQIYEALFEGVVLWAVLYLFRKKNPFKGFLFGAYIAGYGLVRFIIEYFREPDAELGFRIQLGQVVEVKDIAHLHPLLSFSTGQILCFLMIVLACLWWLFCYKTPGREALYFYPENPQGADSAGLKGAPVKKEKSQEDKNHEKNLRKKLKRKG